MKFVLIVLTLAISAAAIASEGWEFREHCQNGRVVRCYIGPYAYECEVTMAVCRESNSRLEDDGTFLGRGVSIRHVEVEAKGLAVSKAEQKCVSNRVLRVSDWTVTRLPPVRRCRYYPFYGCWDDEQGTEATAWFECLPF